MFLRKQLEKSIDGNFDYFGDHSNTVSKEAKAKSKANWNKQEQFVKFAQSSYSLIISVIDDALHFWVQKCKCCITRLNLDP